MIYKDGQRTKKDLKKAFKFYIKSCGLKNDEGCYESALMYKYAKNI